VDKWLEVGYPSNKESGLKWLEGNPMRKLHKSINKRKEYLILITLENIEYI
jgi:hypothetical protein